MRRFRIAGLPLAPMLVALLVASAQAGAAKTQPTKVKHTIGPITTLAMDGPRVVYANGGRVRLWNVVTGATSSVKGRYSNSSYTVNAAEVAIAGKRVAWTKRQSFGNTEASEKLYTSSPAGRAHLLKQGYLFGRNDSSSTTGGWIGGVLGSGKTLAVSTWRSSGTVSSNERLSLITPTGLRAIVTGPGAIVAEAADRGRIAALRSTAAWPADSPATPTTEPTVGIYSTGGTLLREIALTTPIPPPIPTECGCSPSTIFNSIALTGNRLVVLTETNAQPGGSASQWKVKLQVYDWPTGALLHTWPIAMTPWQTNEALPLAAYGRIAAIEAKRKLHLLDLTTGKDITIAPASGTGSPAAIGARGLVYAVSPNYTGRGRLVFVPMARLLAMAR